MHSFNILIISSRAIIDNLLSHFWAEAQKQLSLARKFEVVWMGIAAEHNAAVNNLGCAGANAM